jgi:PAS domain S-box-containing protein
MDTMRVVNDLAARVDPAPPGPWSDPPPAAAVVPIRSHLAHQLAGVLVVGISARLRFDELYASFLELVATQVATAIAHARAYEEERKRAEVLAELDRAKTAFFSNVSHEFRTPLTLMLGPVEDLLAMPEGQVVPEHRELLTVAHRNGLRLQKLVNTLLDFSRLEAGRVEASYEPTDLATVTADLASVFRSAIERAGLGLVVECPPLPEAVYVDRDMWEKIVLNLLSNAFKFTFAGEIAVSLSWDGEHVALRVRDTGTGIPAHEVPHLFERFHRIPNARARTYEGTGIGLALVQELVRLHGGAITVVSEVNVGTTFTVTIPTGTAHLPAARVGAARSLASTALGAEPYVEEALRWLPDESAGVTVSVAAVTPPPPGSRTAAPARILLVDDNADMRDYVRRLLSPHWEVVAVADGVKALEVAGERVPDLVLADVMMPGLDGFALLRALRADPRTAAIPVLLLSARAGEESRVEGLEAGADDYLVKPFSAKELLARVGAHLAMARMRNEMQATQREYAAQLESALEELQIREEERRQQNDALVATRLQVERERARYAALFALAPDAYLVTDTMGVIQEANHAAAALLGVSPEHLMGKPLSVYVAPPARRTFRTQQARLQTQERVQDWEIQLQPRHGRPVPVSISVAVSRSTPAQAPALHWLLRDHTARQQAEAERTRREAAQRFLAEASTLLASSLDATLQLEPLAQLLVPTLADWCSIDLLQDDGWLHRVVVVHADPTKTALAEQLRQQYPLLAAEAPHTLARVLRTGQSWFDAAVSPARLRAEARDAAHWELTQALGFTAEIVVPLLARGRVLGTLTCVLGEGTRRYSAADLALAEELAHRVALALDNTRLYQEARTAQAALQQANASLEQRVQERTALLALIQDVTRAANEAATSAVALQYAVDRLCAYTGWPIGHVYLAVAAGAERWAPTALWHLDAPERFTAFQEATQGLEVAAGEGLVGRVGARGQPEWQSAVATDPTFKRRRAAQATGLSTGVAWPLLVGSEVAGVLEFYTTEALAPNPALLEAMTQIGTQLGRAIERERAAAQARRQQEALLQREKLAAMSTLLANVAHELNNPLASIGLQTELLREDVGQGPLAEPVAAIAQAATRCERLVRQFLTLARQHPPERSVVALNTLVAETVELLTYPLRVDNVTVHLHLDDQLPPLWGDPHQLQQVLLNLLTNAQHALHAAPGAREVNLTTRYDPAPQRITLAVADTGPGIPLALQARIFEPFFTTKPPGVGTGLGLSLCRGIVEAHSGTLEVTSAPGHGATFRLTLPLGAMPASTPTPPSVDEAPVVRGAAVLVVEDEPSLASGLARLLGRDGHTVDTVANGRLALAQLAVRAYDLILCDVRMPELDGPSLYRLLERQQPHLCQRFIFLTGDTLEPATQAFLEASGVVCLTKPFAIAEARSAIQRVLRVAAL